MWGAGMRLLWDFWLGALNAVSGGALGRRVTHRSGWKRMGRRHR